MSGGSKSETAVNAQGKAVTPEPATGGRGIKTRQIGFPAVCRGFKPLGGGGSFHEEIRSGFRTPPARPGANKILKKPF